MGWNWIPLPASTDHQHLVAQINIRLAALAAELNVIAGATPGAFADGVVSPSMAGFEVFHVKQSGPVSIVGFVGVTGAARRVLVFDDGNTTLVHGADLQLAGGVNYNPSAGDVLELVTVDGVTWYELSRGP